MEEFFDEQLVKLLPDYVTKRITVNDSFRPQDAKRTRLEDQRPTEIIDADDDDDDDVVLA